MAKFIFGKMRGLQKLNIFRILCAVVVSISFVSCSNKVENENALIAKDDTFYIQDLSLAYKLPTDAYKWVIVPVENLKPEIKFCGFETENNLCISIVTPDCGDCKFHALTYAVLTDVVRQLIFGRDDYREILLKELQKGLYLNNDSWRFKTVIPFEMDEATVDVAYLGYIFNTEDVITCIMATLPNEQLMNMQPDMVDKYFSALSIVNSL